MCTITLVHHEQTVRLSCNRKWCEALGMGVDYIDDHTIVFPVGSQLAAGPHAAPPHCLLILHLTTLQLELR